MRIYNRIGLWSLLVVIGIYSCKDTTSGPDTKVDKPEGIELTVTSVEPTEGVEGTKVTIGGAGFNLTTSSNKVSFNGTVASVDSASSTKLKTTVPKGATTGSIEVTVDGVAATGPEFEVLAKGAIQVAITTEGLDQDRDGYVVNIDLHKTLSSSINDTLLFQDVEQGNHQLKIEDLDNECSVQGANPQTISVTAQDTTLAAIEVHCEDVVLGNKIVYRHCDGICDGLYVIDSDGTNPRQLTSHPWDTNPVISPDGTKIAFVNGRRNPDVTEHHNEIYIVDASGYPVTQIPRPGESLHDDTPSWSPDGKKLIFSQSNNNSNGKDIVSVNIDGTERKKITDDRPANLWPLYTPDGSKIVFYSLNRGGSAQIFIMNSDGTNITQLSDNDFFASHLALSNDGSKIAFDVQGDPQQIYVMNTDGTGTRQVTNDTNSYAFASWSPDDNHLIFYNFDASDIFKIRLDGTGLTNITDTPKIGESNPHWSPVQ